MTMKDHRSLFRQLLAGMYDAVVITDPNGHVLLINPRAKEFFGYEAEEIEDSPVGKLVPGVTPEIVVRIRNGLEQARHMMIDANCLRKDGTAFTSEVTVSLLDLINPGDLVFTIRNTQRRKRQMDVLRTKENAYEASLAALFACAPDGRFRWVNGAFLSLFGYEREDEVQKLSFGDVMGDEPLPTLFAQALAGETQTVHIVAEEDGEGSKDVEVRLAPDQHGKKITGVVGSVTRV